MTPTHPARSEAGASLLQIVAVSAALAVLAWLTADFLLWKDRNARNSLERTVYHQMGQQNADEASDPALVPNNEGLRLDQAAP